jgi:TolB-like protein
MTEPEARIFYEFSGFRLDVQQRLLTASADGRPIALPPKAFETLLYFVERRGELLEKTTVMKAIWPNIIVEENSLNQNISVIRRALGENPGEHRFIVTEPGRGYRFVAPVSVVANAAAAGPSAPRPVVEVSDSPADASVKSVAVMPFACFTADAEKEYFGDGMAEEIIHLLARVPGLRVPARTSSFAYKGRNTDVRQIARDLDVATVLEGSVRGAGDRIRVTAQLVDGRSGFHLWSHSFDRHFDDIFALQDELAGAILQALEMNLGGRSLAALPPEPPTPSVEAYQLYLQARAQMDRGGAASTLSAIRFLEQAIVVDPKFARAYASLAATQINAVTLMAATADLLSAADGNANRALTLDPANAQAFAILGTLSTYRAQWLVAEQHFRRALSLDPSDPWLHNLYGTGTCLATGLLHATLRCAQESYRLAPASALGAMVMAAASVYLGQDSEGLSYVQLAVNLGWPRVVVPLPFITAGIAINAGRHAEAAEQIKAVLAPEILDAGGAVAVDRIYAAVAGDADKHLAIEALQSLRAGTARAPMLRPVMVMLATNWFTRLGAVDLAYEVAHATPEELETTGVLSNVTFVGTCWLPEMRAFRQDPRFQAYVTRLGLMQYWKQYGPPDGCELKDGKLICH